MMTDPRDKPAADGEGRPGRGPLIDLPRSPLYRRVVILKADRLMGELLGAAVRGVFEHAEVLCVQTVAAAANAVALGFDFLITGVVAADGDVLDHIERWTREEVFARGVVVATSHREPHVLELLARARVRGVLDQRSEGTESVHRALQAIVQGQLYWSPLLRDALVHANVSQESLYRHLTFTEKLVLTLIGDGSDDAAAAEQLGMQATTVMTVRRNLHRKLRIQHKGELVRCATLYGFVLMTASGVVRPGLGTMLAMRSARFPKRDASRAKRPGNDGRWRHVVEVA